MRFDEAFKAMQEGKKVKVSDQNYYISMIGRMFYDGNIDRPVEILSVDNHILREDWEIVE